MSRNTHLSDQSRRMFLQRLSQTIGFAAATTLVAGAGMGSALAYTPKPDSALRQGLVFTQPQMMALKHICSTIIPRTDTASAADVDCHGFVDHQLLQCFSEQDHAKCIAIVDDINAAAKREFKKDYSELSQAQQTSILNNVEAQKGFSGEQKGHFKMLKALIVFGYFTSEEGVTKALVYSPFPGGYKGSVPVTKDTKVSGSLNYY